MPEIQNKARFGGRQNALNMSVQGLAFAINLLLSFFLTPFVVKHIGGTANGFFALSANIMNFASLLVIALNSMAGRFIAIAYFQKRDEDVQKYYSSVLIANIVICFFLSAPMIAFLLFLPSILQVPAALVKDVTGLFIFTFCQFFIIQIGGVFNNSAYVVNRLELISSRNIESKILYVLLIFLTFCICQPRLWQLGLIQAVTASYVVARNYGIHRSVMPQVRIRKKYFEWRKVRELVSSGVWNSVSSLGNLLSDSVDLLIVNMFVSAEAMGVVSVAKVIPFCLSGLICSMASSVAPALTKDFAEGDMKKITDRLLFNMRLMGFFTGIAVAFMAVFGIDFFHLWIPSMDARTLWLVALASLAFMPFVLSVHPLIYIFTSANKVKINSLVYLASSTFSLIVLFCLLHIAHGVLEKMLIVVSIRKIVSVVQTGSFTIPYVAKLLSAKRAPFFRVLGRNILATFLTVAICTVLHYIIPGKGWFVLAAAGILTTAVGAIVGWGILFTKEEKNVLLDFLKRKFPVAGK